MNKKGNSTSVLNKDTVKSMYDMDPLELLGERSFNEPREVNESEIGSPVQEFFRDSVVFLTGGTGFIGKITIEKLLRTCPHIKHIYLLIRSKKGKQIEQRLEEIFEDRVFKRLKYEVPKYYNKISAIAGDCSLPGLGLSVYDMNTLINEVNIVIHGAATVRFDEHIRTTMNINFSGTREILKLARKITNLKVIAHISTAYANCDKYVVEEKFYEPAADYEDVLKLISNTDDQKLQEMTSEIIGNKPNTYSFSKALTEDLIRREAQDLPIFVFRPTIVISTYREPVRGWTDNVYGPIGIIVGAGLGILHAYYGNPHTKCDIMPVDIVVNALICATKEVATNRKTGESPIYTCSSGIQNPLTWEEFTSLNEKYGMYWPSTKSIWYYSFCLTINPIKYHMVNFFCHAIPGYVLDKLAVLIGKKPMLQKIYQKINKMNVILSYFANKDWIFINKNVLSLWDNLDSQDKELFNFDVHQISWDYFFRTTCLGLRVYLVKDDVSTLPEAKKKWMKLYIAHITLKTFTIIFVLYCAWIILQFILKFTGFV